MDSNTKNGILLSIIGGFSNFGIAFLIPYAFPEIVEYPEIVEFLGFLILMLQLFCIIGGSISIFGGLIAIVNSKIGWIIVLIGAITGCGNIISILGAIKLKSTQESFQSISDRKIINPYQTMNKNEEDDDSINRKKQREREEELKRIKSQNPNIDIPDVEY